MKRTLTLAMLMAITMLGVCLIGCGATSVTGSNESAAGISESQRSAPDIDMAKYEDLENGEFVIVLSDGTEEVYNNVKTGNYVRLNGIHVGIEKLNDIVKDEVAAKSKYENAVIVCKGDVAFTGEPVGDYDSVVSLTNDYKDGVTYLGDWVVTFEIPSDEIIESGLTLGKEALCAGYLDVDYLLSAGYPSGFSSRLLARSPVIVNG